MREMLVKAEGAVRMAGNGWKSAANCLKTSYRSIGLVLVGAGVCLVESGAAMTKMWEQHHAGPTNLNATGLKAKFDTNGNVVVTGYSGFQFYTAKYAVTDGRVIWEKIHDERPQELEIDSNGNVVFTGVIEKRTNGVASYQTLIGKYAGDTGAPLWEKRGFQAGVRWWGAALNSANDVIVTSSIVGADGSNDIYLAKLRGGDGELEWETRYASSDKGDDSSSVVTLDTAGDVFLGGNSAGKFFVAKFRGADGELLWKQDHDNPPNQNSAWDSVAYVLVVDSNGDVTAGGNTLLDVLTAKYSGRDGAKLWERVYDQGRERPGINDLSLDQQGNVIVAIVWSDFILGQVGRVYLAKYAAADGATRWEKQVQASNVYNEIRGLSFDSEGNLVAGLSSEPSSSSKKPVWYIWKFAAEDGAVMWEQQLENFVGWNLSMDREGRIAMTGRLDSDFTTFLYQDELAAGIALSKTTNGAMQIKWPQSQQGLQLEMQSGEGLSTTGPWTVISGSTSTNSVTISVQAGEKARFFRLVRPGS